MCDICQNWARTDGKLTDHHPSCPRYNDSLIDVWKVSDGTASFYTEHEDDAKAESGIEDGYPVTITKEKMHREIFEHLPEFDGF